MLLASGRGNEEPSGFLYLFPLSTSVTGGRFEGTNKNNVFNQTISGKGKKKFQGLGMIPLYSYQGTQESLGEEKIRK